MSLFCGKLSEIDLNLYEIVSGPFINCDPCTTTTTSTTTTTTTTPPPLSCCEWDGANYIELNSCLSGPVTIPIQFTQVAPNAWEFDGYTDCGDYIIATITCNPNVEYTDPESCSNKWSITANMPCVDGFTITGIKEPCDCNHPPIWLFSGDASDCNCCDDPVCPDAEDLLIKWKQELKNSPERLSSPLYGSGLSDGPPSAGFKLTQACIRWLCRCVDDQGNVVSSYQPLSTVNNIDLNTLIVEPEGSAGCYLYTFEFFGWRKRGKEGVPPEWISRDDVYNIYVEQIN
jgi:hypothetical protein